MFRAFPPFAPPRFRAHENPHSRGFVRKLRSEFRREKECGTGQPDIKDDRLKAAARGGCNAYDNSCSNAERA